MNRDRRSAMLAAVIGTVLASYAGSAAAIEFEFENGGKLNWNTTVSVGASWRAEDPSERLFTRADGSLIGRYTSPLIPNTAVGPGNGLAGNHAAGDGNLNYAKNDRFSTPFRVITDLEYKKGRFGALLRAKYWYDQALNQENVLVGSQANNFNGVRPRLGPIPGYTLCTAATPPGTACLPVSPPGQNLWPKGKLSDRGFEAEQQFENVYLLDAYVYGSFAVGNTDLQLRLGNQVINWGESIFIQGVNQINPIDVPAARRAGAELKEILLPVWAVYANWGFDFGSIEAFYQLQWNNTSVDACGTYFSATSTLIGADPGSCNSLTVVGGATGNPVIPNGSPIVAQLGSQPFQQGASGTYVPGIQGREPSDSGQFGLAFRFPVEKIDTEIGLYAMNIHSRLPVAASFTGTNWKDLSAAQQAALTTAGFIGTDAYGNYWRTPGSTTRLRSLMPGPEAFIRGLPGPRRSPGQLGVRQGLLGIPRGHPDLRHQRRDQPAELVHVRRTELPGRRPGHGQRQRPDRRGRARHRAVPGSCARGPGPERGRLPDRPRPVQQDPVPGQRGQDLQQRPRRREPARRRRDRLAVEQRARLHQGRHPLRPWLHVRDRFRPGLRARGGSGRAAGGRCLQPR